MLDFNNLPAKSKIYYQDDATVVYCCDNREVLPLFPDKAFDLVLTDPPYNVGKDYGEKTGPGSAPGKIRYLPLSDDEAAPTKELLIIKLRIALSVLEVQEVRR